MRKDERRAAIRSPLPVIRLAATASFAAEIERLMRRDGDEGHGMLKYLLEMALIEARII